MTKFNYAQSTNIKATVLAPVVQRVDSAIHQFVVCSVVCFTNTYRLYSDWDLQ